MNPDFHNFMNEAARLTRSGDLQAATAAIQAALQGGAAPAAHPHRQQHAEVIDVEARSVGDAGDFVSGQSHGRTYKLYIPPHAPANARLVVMLHGCKQNPDDFAAGTRMNAAARDHGCFVLYPAQSRKANPQGCWNWFKHSHQSRDRGEPAMLAGMVREVVAAHGIDAGRVYVAGLSAGGAMAAILGETHPDLFAGVGVHSGLRAGAANDLQSALAAMRSGPPAARVAHGRPTIVFHGDADGTVHPENGEQVLRAAAGEAQAVSESGSNYTRRIYRDGGGHVHAEHWLVHRSGHAWSGGSAEGSYTDPRGPDATREMLRFFLAR